MKQFLVGQIPGGFIGAVIPLSDLDPSDLVKCSLSYRYLEKALSSLPTGLIDRTYTSEALLALLDEDILANLIANLHQAPHVVAELWRISSGFDEELLLDHADWIASRLPKIVFKSSIEDAEGYANFEAMVRSLPESIKASLRSQLSKLDDSGLTILIGRDPRDISTGKKATMDIQPGDTITTTALSLQFKNSLIDQLRYALIKGIRLNQLKLRVTTMSPSEGKVGEYPLESSSEYELLKNRLKPLKKALISLGRSESEATDELESFLLGGTLDVRYNASTWTLAC